MRAELMVNQYREETLVPQKCRKCLMQCMGLLGNAEMTLSNICNGVEMVMFGLKWIGDGFLRGLTAYENCNGL